MRLSPIAVARRLSVLAGDALSVAIWKLESQLDFLGGTTAPTGGQVFVTDPGSLTLAPTNGVFSLVSGVSLSGRASVSFSVPSWAAAGRIVIQGAGVITSSAFESVNGTCNNDTGQHYENLTLSEISTSTTASVSDAVVTGMTVGRLAGGSSQADYRGAIEIEIPSFPTTGRDLLLMCRSYWVQTGSMNYYQTFSRYGSTAQVTSLQFGTGSGQNFSSDSTARFYCCP